MSPAVGNTAIELDHVGKRFRLYHERQRSLKSTVLNRRRGVYEEFWAVDDVSCEVSRGETFGIIGTNGSGKSTLLKCLTRILRPDRGRVAINGTTAALLELGAGFHPELTGRENIYLNGAILGMSRREISQRFDGIVDFSGLERFIDSPVKNYSSGMYAKLGFAVAVHVDPEILLVDEVLAVGDESFQRRCAEKIGEMRAEGRTIVFVSHGLDQVRSLCDRVMWLDKGKVREIGAANDVVDHYVEFSYDDRQAMDERGMRWGTGEVHITTLELLDSDGRPVRKCRTGGRVTIRLGYDAHEPVARPVISFAVFSADGTEVSAPNSSEYDCSPEVLDGPGTIDLEVGSLPLLEGTYDISVGIMRHQFGLAYDVWFKSLRFDVHHGHPLERRGMVTLHPTWRFSPGAEA